MDKVISRDDFRKAYHKLTGVDMSAIATMKRRGHELLIFMGHEIQRVRRDHPDHPSLATVAEARGRIF